MANVPSAEEFPKPKEKYEYRTIQAPDQFRVLHLLPGQHHEPIQIKLSHRPLSFMPQCEAPSYK
ncbi:hypothetical protein DL95DRAFT_390789 [Leptodontidium sp. 2 PMI_412]|nr:hypothetical protein DL95DRAFT_390789 [Leptodontidium sp. 2 PMI_412]